MRDQFILLVAFATCALAVGCVLVFAEEGPHLIAQSVDGKLESGRVGTLLIKLSNTGTASTNQTEESGQERDLMTRVKREYEMRGRDAIGIEAELISMNERITVLSKAQPGGSLAGGQVMNRSMEFVLQVADDAEAGVYPLSLLATYERPTKVEVAGDPNFPEVHIQYERVTEKIPVEVSLVRGPRISADEVSGGASPGKRTTVEIVIANHGDEPAMKLRVLPVSKAPFSSVDIKDIEKLAPSEDSSLKFEIDTEINATPGDYALPLNVSYNAGEEIRSEELVALLKVGMQSEYGRAIFVIPAMILLAVALYVSGAGKYLTRRSRRRRL